MSNSKKFKKTYNYFSYYSERHLERRRKTTNT